MNMLDNGLRNWKHLRSAFNSAWDLLSEEDLNRTDGRRDDLVSLLTTRYGLVTSRAEREVDRLVGTFEAKLKETL